MQIRPTLFAMLMVVTTGAFATSLLIVARGAPVEAARRPASGRRPSSTTMSMRMPNACEKRAGRFSGSIHSAVRRSGGQAGAAPGDCRVGLEASAPV